MARRAQVRTGTVGGCLFNGCMTLCVLLLVAVVGAWISLATQPGRDEAKARADLRTHVEAGKQRLGRAAADGILRDAEIARLFPPAKPAGGLARIEKRGTSTTVIAELLGSGPPRASIFVHETTVEGCYAFHVPPPVRGVPHVSVRRLPDETCASEKDGWR